MLAMIERFFFSVVKSKSNHSGQSQQKKAKQGTNQNSKQIHVTGAKHGKTHLIG